MGFRALNPKPETLKTPNPEPITTNDTSKVRLPGSEDVLIPSEAGPGMSSSGFEVYRGFASLGVGIHG